MKNDDEQFDQKLSELHTVTRSNSLNEMHIEKMTPIQLYMFDIYISKINPRDVNSRCVNFYLSEYARIKNHKGLNTKRIRDESNDFCELTVMVKENSEYRGCRLFKRFELEKWNNEWRVFIDCSDDIVQHLFNLEKCFITYKLTNVLNLKSRNQIRMYEILKQNERMKNRKIAVSVLRQYLGIKDDKYSRWETFDRRVLESCQKVLSKKTDIAFDYEAIKASRNNEVESIMFTIRKNKKKAIEKKPTVAANTSLCVIELTHAEIDEVVKKMLQICNNEFEYSWVKGRYTQIKTALCSNGKGNIATADYIADCFKICYEEMQKIEKTVELRKIGKHVFQAL